MSIWEHNPGSREALDRGCTCAVLDNNHGKWAPWGPNGWWVTEDCPVHNPHGLANAGVETTPITVACEACGGSGEIDVAAPVWDIMDAFTDDMEMEGCYDCAGFGIELVDAVAVVEGE